MNEPYIFYDGACGLCHFMVGFVVKRMKAKLFFFAPLEGPTFQKFKIEAPSNTLVVYLPENRQTLFKGAAVVYILKQLGKPWSFLGTCIGWLPLKLVDVCYSCVAKVRNKLFKRPKNSCPAIPKNLQKFFKE